MNNALARQVHHQRLPLDPLRFHTALNFGSIAALLGLLALVDKIERVAVMSAGFVVNLTEHAVLADSSEPVL